MRDYHFREIIWMFYNCFNWFLFSFPTNSRGPGSPDNILRLLKIYLLNLPRLQTFRILKSSIFNQFSIISRKGQALRGPGFVWNFQKGTFKSILNVFQGLLQDLYILGWIFVSQESLEDNALFSNSQQRMTGRLGEFLKEEKIPRSHNRRSLQVSK